MNVSGSQKLEIIISAYTTLGFYVIPMFLQESNTSLLFFVYWSIIKVDDMVLRGLKGELSWYGSMNWKRKGGMLWGYRIYPPSLWTRIYVVCGSYLVSNAVRQNTFQFMATPNHFLWFLSMWSTLPFYLYTISNKCQNVAQGVRFWISPR